MRVNKTLLKLIPSISPKQDGVRFGCVAGVEAEEQHTEAKHECENYSDFGVAMSGASAKRGYPKSAHACEKEKTVNWANPN